MGLTQAYETIRVRSDGDVATIRLDRPGVRNAINGRLVAECAEALAGCAGKAKIIVLEGSPEYFCFGADFEELGRGPEIPGRAASQDPGRLYDLWLNLATGPSLTIAHVRGKANAGGVGFAAACDLVLCEEKAVFSLSELLFGLMPACVLPFLIRRIGFSRANTMTLSTQPVTSKQALEWGLADACEADSENLLRKQLLRLRRLDADGISRYKRYMAALDGSLRECRAGAIAANREVFSDPANLDRIARYVKTGLFPWEAR